MAKQKLTKSVVERLIPASTDYFAWDAELPGFGVRVKPSGIKSYIVQYRNRKTGASRRKTIGQHGPLLTFHKARERARIILADALNGNDPVEDDRAVRATPTMKEFAADYLEQHAIPKKRPRSVENDRSMLDRIITSGTLAIGRGTRPAVERFVNASESARGECRPVPTPHRLTDRRGTLGTLVRHRFEPGRLDQAISPYEAETEGTPSPVRSGLGAACRDAGAG